MKLIKSSWSIVDQEEGIIGMKRQAEKGGRICYRSENRMDETSYQRLLQIFDDRKHYSPLAHGTVYLWISSEDYGSYIYNVLKDIFIADDINGVSWFLNPLWTRLVWHDGYWAITTNYRVIKELNLESLLEKYWCEPNNYHIRRVSVEVECSRATADEWMRHASSLAICCESTRYCNYSGDKYGNELTFIEPYWYSTATDSQKLTYESQLSSAEQAYLSLTSSELPAQAAREVLPLNIKAKVMFTGFVDAWEHIFELRTTTAAHPDIVAIMKPLAAEFKSRGYTTKDYE